MAGEVLHTMNHEASAQANASPYLLAPFALWLTYTKPKTQPTAPRMPSTRKTVCATAMWTEAIEPAAVTTGQQDLVQD